MFFWNSLAFSIIQQMLAVQSLVPLPFLKPAWTSRSSWFTYCWSLAWRILSMTLLACEMSAIVQYFEHSLSLPFFGIGMKTDLFQSCGYCWVFQICWHIECSTFPASESFPMSQLFAWGGQSTGASALASFPSKEIPGLISFRMDWLDVLKSKGLSRVFSNTIVQKHQFFSAQPFSQSNSHIHTWPLEKP